MCRESKLQDIGLCSAHVDAVAKHDVEVDFSNVSESQLFQIRNRT